LIKAITRQACKKKNFRLRGVLGQSLFLEKTETTTTILILLRDLTQWQCEPALLLDEELRKSAVVGDHGCDDAEGAAGLVQVGL
jgi:hypothetical protein